MLDVHMVTLPSDVGSEWLHLQLHMLEVQSFDIRLTLLDGALFDGHIGRARAEGFRQAQGDWVCFVDPDDWCAPDIFAKLTAAVQRNPDVDAVYSRDMVCDINGVEQHVAQGFGHAMAYRKSKIRWDLLEAAPHGAELWMKRADNRIVLPDIGYYFRQYPTSPSKLRHNRFVLKSSRVQAVQDPHCAG